MFSYNEQVNFIKAKKCHICILYLVKTPSISQVVHIHCQRILQGLIMRVFLKIENLLLFVNKNAHLFVERQWIHLASIQQNPGRDFLQDFNLIFSSFIPISLPYVKILASTFPWIVNFCLKICLMPLKFEIWVKLLQIC